MFGSKFWDSVAAGVAQRWVDRLLSPALLFWAGGFVAWAEAHGGLAAAASRLQAMTQAEQVLLAAGGVVLVVASAAAVEQLEYDVLRVLEGYGWPARLVRWRRQRLHKGRLSRMRLRHVQLGRQYDELDPDELAEYGRLDEELRTYPGDARLLPTRLGNLLRAAEDHAWGHYGLATRAVWASLWLLLPGETRQEITDARSRLNAAARLWLWALLFAMWTVWARWAIVVAAVGMWLAYQQALLAAGVYGDLLRAAFNVHRTALYRALRWPLPGTPQEEYELGQKLSDYLRRGSRAPWPSFGTETESQRR